MTSTSHADLTRTRLTFGGILRSEWIKLWTLRSTFWCSLIVIVLGVGFGLLVSVAQRRMATGGVVSHASQQGTAVLVATIGVDIGQLVVSVLGVLVISGEYGTGMIRSTFAADPKRLGSMFGKAIVLGVTTFLLGLITIWATVAAAFPLLPNSGIHPDLGDSKVVLALFGAALYLALISLIAFSLGAIIRNTAGGIAAALGVILVLPALLGIVERLTQATWLQNVTTFLPTSAGDQLFAYEPGKTSVISGVVTLDGLVGGLVLLGWFIVLFVAALVLIKRRDA
jgi:ABC-2 type transport system permease protein